MAYLFDANLTAVPEHNHIPLAYWKITQRNACSASRIDWVVELSGYTSKADRDNNYNPFDSRQIVFTPDDHPVNEDETELLMDDNKPADFDQYDKHKYYVHITRLAGIAHGKAAQDRTASEAACLFFYGTSEA